MKEITIPLDQQTLDELNNLKKKHLYKPDAWSLEQWVYEVLLNGIAKLKEEN